LILPNNLIAKSDTLDMLFRQKVKRDQKTVSLKPFHFLSPITFSAKPKITLFSLFATLLLFFLIAGNAAADQKEVILSFSSEILVHADSRLTVSETITVIALGNKIKRGIYRDLYTKSKDHSGNTINTDFTIKEVLKNGSLEPYHTKKTSNGIRVYIGDKNVYLRQGVYTYKIVYESSSQLGFLEQFDELYWNVTGNNWAFPIETASVDVMLPTGASILQSEGYTGPIGSKGKHFRIIPESTVDISFVTTRRLLPGEGFTIAVAWPKGFVSSPTFSQKIRRLYSSSHETFVCLAIIGAILIYFTTAWFRVGKDPDSKAIIPQTSPPGNHSPAAARFLKQMEMSTDYTTLTATILNMAVKGYLVIQESEENRFNLVLQNNLNTSLTREEQAVGDILFGDGKKTLSLYDKNRGTIKEIELAQKALLKALNEKYGKGKGYFSINNHYGLPGCLGSLVIIIGLLWYAANNTDITSVDPTVFAADHRIGIVALLIFWTVGIYAGTSLTIKSWLSGRGWKSFLLLLISLPFGLMLYAIMFFNNIAVSPVILVTLIIIPAMNMLFYELLKAPSEKGQNLLDQFAGFALYLSVAEKDRLNLLNPPKETPELFSKFLPWALALDVEQQWSERFSSMLQKSGYQPTWYHGTHSTTTISPSFASGFHSAMSSAGSSSSSSGSSGGGSSGGGGGGGGGGGW